MQTYTTLNGRVLDLTGLTAEEEAFLERAVQVYRTGPDWDDFDALISDHDANPLLRATGGWVTRSVLEHPLYVALQDLLGRIAVREGAPVEAGERPERDPFDDEGLPVAEAARRKQVTVQALHQAIGRGAVVAWSSRPGGTRRVVSRNSVERWTPRAARRESPPRANVR